MMKSARMPVHELNPYLTCVLCGGYLIDATTIIECLHSFCRTCIVHYLHTSNYCPVCECLVHKKYPHQNLRSDKTLQDIVYKLVPGLFMEEMRRRRKYYNVNTDDSQRRLGRIIFSPEEKISLCMRLCTRRVCESSNQDYEFQDKRYLLCPAQMSVYHLKKFLRLKYSLSDRLEVELFHVDEVLRDEYSLVDVSYITGWTREHMMVLNYAFYENSNKKFKGNSYSGAVSPGNEDSGIEDENSNQDDNNPDKNHVTSQSSQASKENDNQQPSDGDGNAPDSPPADEKENAADAVDTTEKDASVDIKQDTVNVEGKEDIPEHAEKQNSGTDAEKHNDVREESGGKEGEMVSLNLPNKTSDPQRKVDVLEKDNHAVEEKEESNFIRTTPGRKSNSVAIEDDEGALQIVIDDSKSEKSSDDSGIQVSENSPNENDSVCSNESRSPSVPIKIPHPEMFKPPISYHNGEDQSKSPKTSTPFHSLNSPSSKYPRFTDSLVFNDSGFSSYSSVNDSIAQTSSCPQTDFDTDEIWTDGVMDLSKPKLKGTDCYQDVRSSVAEDEDEEEVEKYTYVVDGLEEADGDMEVDSGYANEDNTPERYSVLSPDQNEVTSTRMEHIPYQIPAMVGKPQFYTPKLSASSNLLWKGEKIEDASKKSSSGKHHKRRKSSESSKHKVVSSNGHSKCTEVCNGHSVEPRSESSTYKKHQSEKFILNQPRCEKLIISQPRCEKAPRNKPRCEKLVVKLSKERNSENYTATMS